jgi:UDP-glucose 4-epimerase
MKIVILGGSGFIGKSLAHAFSQQGHDTVTISRSPLIRLNGHHSHYDITLDDNRNLLPLLSDAHVIFHLASDSTPGSSRLQPTLEGTNNIIPTLRLLENLQEIKQATFVYISSGGAVYDHNNPEQIPFLESSPTNPMSYYGAGKLAIEYFISAYNHQTGNRAIILRPSNVYGPGQVAKKQFGIIPTLFNAISHRQEFQIWGDGSAVRDYLYIHDLISLCTSIVNTRWPEGTFKTYNAGSSLGLSILDLINAIEEVTGETLHKVFHESRGVDIPSVVLDNRQAKNDFQWQPQVDIMPGLKQTWEWHKKTSNNER